MSQHRPRAESTRRAHEVNGIGARGRHEPAGDPPAGPGPTAGSDAAGRRRRGRVDFERRAELALRICAERQIRDALDYLAYALGAVTHASVDTARAYHDVAVSSLRISADDAEAAEYFAGRVMDELRLAALGR